VVQDDPQSNPPSVDNLFSADPYANRFLYTGREFLKEANLYDYRNRVYSAELGRFLQTDPIRFEAGDGNLYRYVGNRSTMLTDPFGLCPEDEEGEEDDWLDDLQLGLDIAGLVPVIGEVADAANALLSLGRGDYKGAALSAAAMLSVGGQAATAAKLGRQAAKGLTTPSQYFGKKTAQEVSEAMTRKFGPPKSVRKGAETFYNPKTQRSFNVHTDPAHGSPHGDIRRRGGFPERKYPLGEDTP
jgi:RHS repeat-associated protein